MARLPIRPTLAAVLGAAALGCAVDAGAAPGPRAVAASTRMQVTQVEYRLLLSRGVLRAGPINLEAVDRGADPHDLRVRALGGTHELIAPQLRSGQRWSRVVYLRPGVYRLWCSLPEHARLGMRATLRVLP